VASGLIARVLQEFEWFQHAYFALEPNQTCDTVLQNRMALKHPVEELL